MPRRLMAISIFLTLWVTGAAYAAAPPTYYLALGDSLARGVQPNRIGGLGETHQGYVDDLYAYFRLRRPDLNLQLVNISCTGETLETMRAGGHCLYPLGSQLAQAADFIQTHHVALITLTIGGDDILQCVNANAIDFTKVIDPACVQEGLADVIPQLTTILGALRTAAAHSIRSQDVAIVASNYNDPLLGLLRFGP